MYGEVTEGERGNCVFGKVTKRKDRVVSELMRTVCRRTADKMKPCSCNYVNTAD